MPRCMGAEKMEYEEDGGETPSAGVAVVQQTRPAVRELAAELRIQLMGPVPVPRTGEQMAWHG